MVAHTTVAVTLAVVSGFAIGIVQGIGEVLAKRAEKKAADAALAAEYQEFLAAKAAKAA
jgi:hypothetical protein